VRIVHTSDVHLGAYPARPDGYWDEKRRMLERAFSNVVSLAIAEEADALVIAGDFFDNDRVDPETVAFAAREIARYGRFTLLVPGNHDPMDDGRIYWRHDLEAAAPNLRIVREHAGETVAHPDAPITFWGRAFRESDWHFRPLAGLPPREADRWHVAVGHGHLVREREDLGRAMLIHREELEAAAGHWDYVALGHWEGHADVSVPDVAVVYSGAPLALSELNQHAGWAAVVDLSPEGVRWRLARVHPREVGGEGMP
jgi:DNA repair exonuclease SbcCD nuclease subunit